MITLQFNGTKKEATILGTNLPLHCRELIPSQNGNVYSVPINAIRRNEINETGYKVTYH